MQMMPQIRQVKNLFRNANNPTALIVQMAQSNPQMKQVTDLIAQNDGNAQKAFLELCNKQGMDPQEILALFK